MALIYRIEHRETCEGIYHPGSEGRIIMNDWSGGGNFGGKHPCPGQDSLLVREVAAIFPDACFLGEFPCWESFYYGFDSFLQLRRWFFQDKVLEDLSLTNYVLRVYSVEQIAIGHTQAVILEKDHCAENIFQTISLLEIPKFI